MKLLRIAFLLTGVTLVGLAAAISTSAGPYRLDLTSEPPVLPVGKATLDLLLTDSSGHPIDGAQIRGIAQMPNMPMGEREQPAVPTGTPGHYRLSQSFAMAGGYAAHLSIVGPSGPATALIPLETGQATSTGASRPSFGPTAVMAIAGFVLLILLLRAVRGGRAARWRSVVNAPVIVSLTFLALVIVGAVYAVNHYRRSGAMTPVEAETMSMEMFPPEGVTPVTLATVRSAPLAASVQYAGQVAGYQDVAVAARTTGVVLWMPAYVGTVIRKGELIARLDTSQLQPQLRSQRAAAETAIQGVGVAKAEQRKAEAMIHQAESELGQFQGAVAESAADRAAAQAQAKAADAEALAARADLGGAQARLQAARADREYWRAEMQRETALFSKGAVSRDELQKEQAELAKSDANTLLAEQDVLATRAKIEAAVANVRRSEAMVAAATRKVEQAKSELLSHHAHVQVAQAEAMAAESKVGQAGSGVKQADAELSAATAQVGYSEVRAAADGVVTERVVSPGTLVAAGQTLLKFSTIEPIRLQANVPQQELGSVRVGQLAWVTGTGGGHGVSTPISTVSPAVDPVERTGIVEAVFGNKNHLFIPGQFVSMRIPLGSARPVLQIPAAAVQASVASGDAIQAGGSSSYVWVAVLAAGSREQFTVSRKNVALGLSSGDSVAVTDGLREGDRVVLTGAAGLQEGQSVEAAAMTPVAVNTSLIRVTEQGFEPDTLTVSSGHSQLTFLRTTEQTCAKEVVFPELGIRQPLPLNRRVVIDLPPSANGEVHFACGMNMLHGSVVVR